MNDYKWTDRARKVLQIAREEATFLCHEYIGTEHLLLALLREGEGVASAVLTNLDVDTEAIRHTIYDTCKAGRGQMPTDQVYTSRARKVLEFAMAESHELNHKFVGTEHLLLGLLREEKGIAAQLLTEAKVSLERARAEALRLLGADLPTAPPPAPSHQHAFKCACGARVDLDYKDKYYRHVTITVHEP
jgi:ATP-dependent Clp protease ATP-binding subunit ClpC